MTSKSDILFDLFENKIPNHYQTTTIRESQVQMAFDIAEFIEISNKKKFMIIESPVGTGKSLGALVPTLVDIKNEMFGKRNIIYATATINLQGQLMNSEVPLLKKLSLLGNPLIAKGKSHYYCHRRFKSQSSNEFSPKEQQELIDFFTKAETGQRSELGEIFKTDFSDQMWKKVELEASKSECERCDFSLSCPTRNHRRRFRLDKNDLTITNHDQLIVSYLNVMEGSSSEPILPIDPGILIIDEAHHFLENFLGRLEKNFLLKHLKALRRSISKKWKMKFDDHIRNIESVLNYQKTNMNGSLQGRYPIPENILKELKALYTIINNSIVDITEDYYDHIAEKLDEWSIVLGEFLEDDYVKWLDFEEFKFSTISNSFPTDFKNMMSEMTKYNKVIIMSGTLTENGDFKALLNQWRLDKNEVVTKSFVTPFDYKNQAIVFIPDKISEPNEDDFVESTSKWVKRLISLTNGRTLLLNTSKEHMLAEREYLKPLVKELEICLFIQGESGVERLTKQFKEIETSILIGSGSFFSGFSIPGMALTSVILNKLPFPVKDDPFLQLIGEGFEGKDFFDYITFPHMVNKLDQAAGRLIRSIDDYGIFTVLDPRVFSASYSNRVQKLLQSRGYIITREWDEVENFYNQKLNKGAEANYQEYSNASINVSENLKIPLKKQQVKAKIQSTPNIKVQKEKRLLKRQREFVNDFCEKQGMDRVTGHNAEDVYRKLLDILYYDWKDTTYLKENFPYRDEEEKKQLQQYKGDKKRTVMPKCTKLGCNGLCELKGKEVIQKYVYDKYKANKVDFIKNTSFCWVSISPTEILENEEFRPD